MSEERVRPHGEQTDRIIRELVREVIEDQIPNTLSRLPQDEVTQNIAIEALGTLIAGLNVDRVTLSPTLDRNNSLARRLLGPTPEEKALAARDAERAKVLDAEIVSFQNALKVQATEADTRKFAEAVKLSDVELAILEEKRKLAEAEAVIIKEERRKEKVAKEQEETKRRESLQERYEEAKKKLDQLNIKWSKKSDTLWQASLLSKIGAHFPFNFEEVGQPISLKLHTNYYGDYHCVIFDGPAGSKENTRINFSTLRHPNNSLKMNILRRDSSNCNTLIVVDEQKCVFGENDEVRDIIIFLNESQRLIHYFRIEYLRGQGHIELTEVIPGTNP